MTETAVATVTFEKGDKVLHIPSGSICVVIRLCGDYLLCESGRGHYLRYALDEWRKEQP